MLCEELNRRANRVSQEQGHAVLRGLILAMSSVEGLARRFDIEAALDAEPELGCDAEVAGKPQDGPLGSDQTGTLSCLAARKWLWRGLRRCPWVAMPAIT
jgi:hypothetical protein